MATLDETNIFQTPVTAQEPKRFSPEYFTQRQEQKAQEKAQYKALGQSVRDNLALGNIEQAYESFAQLPVVDQMSLYMTPGVGNLIDAYEYDYLKKRSGRELKDPEAYQLELLMGGDPREVNPFTQKDPVSGAFSTLAGLSSLAGLGEIPSLIKGAMLPLARRGMQAKVGEGIGGGGGGIGALPQDIMQEDVMKYARSGMRYSPTMKGLIEKAPKNLKGESLLTYMKNNPQLYKPKELQYFDIENFIKQNPDADVRQIIEKMSGDKPILRVTEDRDYADYNDPNTFDADEFMEFDTQILERDPISGETMWDYLSEDIYDDINRGGAFYGDDLARLYESSRTIPEKFRGANAPEFTFDDMVAEIQRANEGGFSTETIDDIVDEYARELYMQEPVVQTWLPNTNLNGNRNFIVGNDGTGYSIFIDGKRIETDPVYSLNEAEIQFQNELRDRGLINFTDSEATQYKQYVDDTLPGGSNYRELRYRLTPLLGEKLGNHPQHFEGDTVYSILGRDRKLDDGTNSFHVDELQADVHQKAHSKKGGSAPGYRTPERIAKMNELDELKNKEVKRLVDKNRDKYEEILKIITDLSDDNLAMQRNKIYEGFTDKGLLNQSMWLKTVLKKLLDDPSYDDLMQLRDVDFANVSGKALGAISAYDGNQWKILNDDLAKDFVKITELPNLLDDANKYLESINYPEYVDKYTRAVPDFPYKEDWYKKAVEDALLHAIDEGQSALSISGSYPIINRYSDVGAEFKKELYDKLIPAHMEKLAKMYGGEFKKGSLDIDNTFGLGTEKYLPQPETGLDRRRNLTKSNIIVITPEMRKKINKEGLPAFALGGKVTRYKSMDKPIMGGTRDI